MARTLWLKAQLGQTSKHGLTSVKTGKSKAALPDLRVLSDSSAHARGVSQHRHSDRAESGGHHPYRAGIWRESAGVPGPPACTCACKHAQTLRYRKASRCPSPKTHQHPRRARASPRAAQPNPPLRICARRVCKHGGHFGSCARSPLPRPSSGLTGAAAPAVAGAGWLAGVGRCCTTT